MTTYDIIVLAIGIFSAVSSFAGFVVALLQYRLDKKASKKK